MQSCNDLNSKQLPPPAVYIARKKLDHISVDVGSSGLTQSIEKRHLIGKVDEYMHDIEMKRTSSDFKRSNCNTNKEIRTRVPSNNPKASDLRSIENEIDIINQ